MGFESLEQPSRGSACAAGAELPPKTVPPKTAVRRRLAWGALALAFSLFAAAPAALAAPPSPPFGPAIDAYAEYKRQSTCDPTAKPGVLAFRDLLLQAYGPRTHSIVRSCRAKGRSEHKEGRALDWSVNVSKPEENSLANEVLAWLLSRDQHGNAHAFARRLGIMYVIWNRKIWGAYKPNGPLTNGPTGGWRKYTGKNPHTDHIHFSFSWAGARKETTWWRAPAEPLPSPSPRVTRIWGGDRMGTALSVSSTAFPKRGSARNVFLARSTSWPDALTAATLAGRFGGPVLLTSGAREPERWLRQEVKRVLGTPPKKARERKKKTVWLVGGGAVLPGSMAKAFRPQYRVERRGGSDRYETARLAASDVAGRRGLDSAIVASGESFVDALPMLAVAARNDWPLLLTPPRQLGPAARDFLARRRIKNVHIAGPPGVVSDRVAGEIRALGSVNSVSRHFGATRSHTSTLIGERFFPRPAHFVTATGWNWPDAAVAAPYAGNNLNAPILLLNRDDVTTYVSDYVRARMSSTARGYVIGGTEALTLRAERNFGALFR
jgi:putative cell wall-binding protein